MKRMDNIKRTVLGIGCTALLASAIGALSYMSIAEFLFPIYCGLVLIGTVLLNREENYVEA